MRVRGSGPHATATGTDAFEPRHDVDTQPRCAARRRSSRQDAFMANSDQQPWVAHYQPGVPAEIDLPTESLVAMLEQSVAEAGRHPACLLYTSDAADDLLCVDLG